MVTKSPDQQRTKRELEHVEQLVRVALDDDTAADQLFARLRREHPAVRARADATVDALQSIRAAHRTTTTK